MINEIIQSDFKIIRLYATDLWFSKNNIIEEIIKISENDLQRISQLTTPNKVLAIVGLKNPILDILEILEGITLVLDNIKDPGNLGTIIRICDWFNIRNIICSFRTVDVYNPKVIQSSMGSLTRVNLYYENILEIIDQLPEDFPIYSASLDGQSVLGMQLSKNGLLIMGNESFGISKDIHALVTSKILIPRYREGIDSLNVAVATSILLHEFKK